MRWMAVALLLCALPLAAQSLGDVARTQRDSAKCTKARHVITNDDLPSAAQPLPSPPARRRSRSPSTEDNKQMSSVLVSSNGILPNSINAFSYCKMK
jgi:hypothetical protein